MKNRWTRLASSFVCFCRWLPICASDLRDETERQPNASPTRLSTSPSARKLNQNPALDDVHYLEPLFNEAMGILKDSIRAFIEGDVELALAVKVRDKKAGRGKRRSRPPVHNARMAEAPDRITDFLNLLLYRATSERVIIQKSTWKMPFTEGCRRGHPTSPCAESRRRAIVFCFTL